MGIQFIVKQTPVPQWVQIFDNTDWVVGDTGFHLGGAGSWDAGNQEWDSDDGGGAFGVSAVELLPLGGWEVGYRPSKIRITFTGIANLDLYFRDTAFQYLVTEGQTITSGQELDITFSGNDIRSLLVWSFTENPFSVTNIEFLL